MPTLSMGTNRQPQRRGTAPAGYSPQSLGDRVCRPSPLRLPFAGIVERRRGKHFMRIGKVLCVCALALALQGCAAAGVTLATAGAGVGMGAGVEHTLNGI